MTGPDVAAARERRVDLLLAALRLSRAPDLLPRLDAALAALDDGSRPWAAPPDEAGVLRRVRGRMAETLSPEAAAAWDEARRAEAGACAAAAAAERLGRAPRAGGAPPRITEAARAAGELLARSEAGEPAGPGAATAGGWRVAAVLELGGGGDRLAWLPTALWAVLPPDDEGGDGDAEPVFVAAGGHAPEAWRWDEVRAELDRRRRAVAAAEAFVRAAAAGGPAPDAARGNTGGGQEGPMGDDERLAGLGVRINVFGDPTRIARALGLDVELPDVDSRDPAYWNEVRRVGWKPALRGRVADTEEERGDPDWCTLQVHGWGKVRFDLEEGVVVVTTVGGLLPALDLVHGLAGRGVPLREADGSALVKVMQAMFGRGVPDASAAFAAAGLAPEPGRPGTICWELSPVRWPSA